MATDYTRGQKVLHWLLAVLILFWLFVSGELVQAAEGEEQGFILMFHSGGAMVILVLMLFRLKLRLNRPVSLPVELKVWEKVWSKRVHMAFYLLVILMACSGLLQGIFFDRDVRIFGMVNITMGHNESLMGFFNSVHGLIANLLKILIGLHVLATLKHQFIDKRPAFRRMF